MDERTELKTWGLASVVLVLVAVSVFLIQHFIMRSFDVVIEISVFYVPAAASIAIFLYFWSKLRPSRSR